MPVHRGLRFLTTILFASFFLFPTLILSSFPAVASLGFSYP